MTQLIDYEAFRGRRGHSAATTASGCFSIQQDEGLTDTVSQ
jgi:hypothetical protein